MRGKLSLMFSVALLGAGFRGTPAAAATWGSVRANNRSVPLTPGAPRAFPSPQAHLPQAVPDRHSQIAPERRPQAAPEREREFHGEAREREGENRISRERGREVEMNRGHEWAQEARERRHLDIDEDRRHGFFWHGFHPGIFLGALPLGYAPIYVQGNPYYYYQGVYYEPAQSGYVVVSPPLGAIVPVLPPGAEPIEVGNAIYYYAGGAFYVPQPQGYLVVTPPPGIVVSELPPGAVPVFINGRQYYQADGAYFLPVMQNGVTVFETVQP